MRRLLLLGLVVFVGLGLARSPWRGDGKFTLFPTTLLPIPADSFHSFDVRHYRVDLNLPMVTGAYSARVRVALVANEPNFDTFSLHMVNLVCDSVRRDGNACAFSTGAGRLRIDLDREFGQGESLAVDIYYRRLGSVSNRGFFWYTRYQTGYHALAYTTTQPADARYWLPCFDEPWDKAEDGCCINVTVPDSMAVAANGLLDSVTVNAGNRTKTYWWRHEYPISTYLMTFAASRWAQLRHWFHYSPTESSYVQTFVWPADSGAAVAAFANIVDMIDFFSDSLRYGRYPFEKYGHVEAYPFEWGGMENQTMTMVHRYWVVYGSDNGIAHELAHQWWGDMVTCQDWREIWLNEGFATYSDELYEYHRSGRTAFLNLIASRAEDYFEEEAEDPRPIYDPPFPDQLFGWGHTYCKAAWVQHMLRFVEGDTVWTEPGIFFRAMRVYGDSFRYRNANTQDYRRIHEQVTGLDLGWFFDEWVYGLGYPNYTVGWFGRQVQYGWEVVIDVEQHNMSGAPSLFHMPVEVKVNWSGGSQTFRFDVAANPQRAVFSVPAQPTGIVFDPNDWILERHTVRLGVAEDVGAGVRARLLSLGPNPATGRVELAYTVPAERPVQVDIYDQAGRLVRRLVSGPARPGPNRLVWNCTDEEGRQVGAGVYTVRLASGADNDSRKLVLRNR